MKPIPTSIILTTTLILAALALAAASTATAATFQISGAGTVKLKSEGTQELAVEGIIGPIECREISGNIAVASPLLKASITLLITIGGCEAFGTKSTVTTGELLFNANGSVRIGRTDKFVITPSGEECSVKFLSENETSEQLLGTIKYTNNANGTVTGVLSKVKIPAFVNGPGTLCGALGTGKATYTGTFITELVGGRISVEK
jgi:hypothetical protein